MASEDTSSATGIENPPTSNSNTLSAKNLDNLGQIRDESTLLPSATDDPTKSKNEKERKLGHRRVGEGGEITYKKIQTSQIMGSIQLGIQHTVGSLASKPKRDLLMMDFFEIESITFPPEGSALTPAHHYSEFRYKIYAPIAFRYFRDLFGIRPDDFMMSMCHSALRELSNPGASGSIFYLTADDEFIIKTVQHKEGEFLQKLLPGYYMNLNQNPRTLLPKFFGLYCLQTSNAKNIRLVVMNNLLPSFVKLHQKYDLKGSTFKRKASKSERSKKSPTYKDLDFMEQHPNGIFLEADTYSALTKTIQRDCTVLESFKIMDYSLLLGIHNLDLSMKEKRSERGSRKKTQQSDDSDIEDVSDAEPGRGQENKAQSFSKGNNRNRSINRQRLVAHSTAMESIQAESEPIDDEEDVPPGGIPARNEKGERLLLFIGIIDILQSYRLKKKLEHTFKSIIHDGDTVSVCRPSFYAHRFQSFMAKTVFRKIPSLDLPEIKGNHRKFRTLVTSYIALKHSPSKRKSLSKAIQRSVDSDDNRQYLSVGHVFNTTSTKDNYKDHQKHRTKANSHLAAEIETTAVAISTASSGNIMQPPPVNQRLSTASSTASSAGLKPKVPPPVPPRGSPRPKKVQQQHKELSPGAPVQDAISCIPKPQFGEQHSPSNVDDWLELHNMRRESKTQYQKNITSSNYTKTGAPYSTTPSCSSTPPPAFDDISNSSNISSTKRKSHQNNERKMNIGPSYRNTNMEDNVSISDIHLDTQWSTDYSSYNQSGSHGGLAWTPPASGEGSTPTWTEGTPSFTDSSLSGELDNLSPINYKKNRQKAVIEDALNSLSADMFVTRQYSDSPH